MDKKTLSRIEKIRELAQTNPDGLSLEEVFARCFGAVQDTLDITPFDQQLAAAIALTEGKMVQMQTGEGKTLSAVFAACFEALQGGKVHVMTFNDYLAQRDFEWMRPVYDKMGITVGCITEKTPENQRRELYGRQVLYITAKEAGFDYLRDFVRMEPSEMVFPQELNLAIVDEADSILIDEARIPLVIAGDIAVNETGDTAEIYRIVDEFTLDDFGIDEESRNVYLTDSGADKAEAVFKCDLFGEDGTLHAKICACLKAKYVLKPDKDYILKDNKLLLVDEFTGRTAPGRVFPGELQTAVEAKHNLKITSRGRIMGQIALQYFLRSYPKLSGMTGTAAAAREEFEKLYGLLVEVIPTRLPCIRDDKPLEMYFNKEEKWIAVIEAIKQANAAHRPVLVGTESIDESEKLSAQLTGIGIKHAVLNAKNDREEADIIARAGEPDAVTISTNMAGRGIDIKLGGSDCRDKALVEKAGGLLVLATSMRESARITRQLRGRAGRQGDVGESRFFSALDDEMMKKHNLKSLVHFWNYPKKRVSGALKNRQLLKEAERIQRISEGNALDDRLLLMRYHSVTEKHREFIFGRRRDLICGKYNSNMWQEHAPELYKKAAEKFGEEPLQKLQNRILAQLLNEFWCDYLDYTAYLREGIHLTQIAGKNPAEEFGIGCEEYYTAAADSIPERMKERLEKLLGCEKAEEYKIQLPTQIYTYLLDDEGDEFKPPSLAEMLASDGEYKPLLSEREKAEAEKAGE